MTKTIEAVDLFCGASMEGKTMQAKTPEEKQRILKLWQEDGKSIAEISQIIGLDIWDIRSVTEADYRRHVRRVEAD